MQSKMKINLHLFLYLYSDCFTCKSTLLKTEEKSAGSVQEQEEKNVTNGFFCLETHPQDNVASTHCGLLAYLSG